MGIKHSSQHSLTSGSMSQPDTTASSIDIYRNAALGIYSIYPTSLHQRPTGTANSDHTEASSARDARLEALLSIESLPGVPEDLESVTEVGRYVQRARELATKDPVLCFWCKLSYSALPLVPHRDRYHALCRPILCRKTRN